MRAVKPVPRSQRNGGFGKHSVLHEATALGVFTAQLRRRPSRSAMSASRRHETSPHVSNAQIAVIAGRRGERVNRPENVTSHADFVTSAG